LRKLIATLALAAGIGGVFAAAAPPASALVCVRVDIVVFGTSIGPIPTRTCV